MPLLNRPFRRSTRRSLVVIFAFAAALLVVSIAVVFIVGRASIQSQAVMARQLALLDQLHTLGSTLKDAETGQRGYVLTGKDSYLQPHTEAVIALQTEQAALHQFVDSGDLPKDEMDQLSSLIHQKLAELDRTIRLRRDQSLQAALDFILTDEGKVTMDEIRQMLTRFEHATRDRYDGAVERAQQIENWRAFTFLIAAVVNLAFLFWAFKRISLEEWLQTGQTQLAQKLAGDQKLDQLGDNALRYLAEYTGAQVGAIYLENGGEFQRFSAYALHNPQAVPARIKSGEGLVGQAVKDGRPFVVNDVPNGYFTVGSALGSKTPRRLIVSPVRADNAINGVLELGYFDPGDQTDIDLFERVSELIGVAVRSAKFRAQLQDLLEETQRQSEELQTQSEELRVSNEELEEQSRALKESQARLEQQQIELEQTNSQLEEQTQILETQKDDISRAKAELERQAAAVEQASRYKSDFLANMSHELRTPLNSSLILAKLLADNPAGNLSEEQVKFAQTIQSSGNDLLALINDVLDLAKVEAGHMELNPTVFPLAHLLESMRGTFEPMARNKGLNLRFNIRPGSPETIEADRRRLEQVLKNLLSNALKFTERGEVKLETTSVPGGKIAVTVSDTGIGIPEDQRQIIFEPFCQADSTASRKYGGTGLGLSISRELVRLMGGEIQLQSQLGVGSSFTLTLPVVADVALAAPPPPPVSPPRPRPVPKSSPIPAATAVRSRPRVADDREHLSGSGRLMLIVEDDQPFASILLDLGHEMDFQCLVADTSEEALALAAQFLPSAIILDIGLPDNSGMFVLERLKADARTRHVPVHVVSGSDYSQTAMAMGAVGYMLKPVKREELVEAFQKLETRLTQRLRRVLVVEDDDVQLDSLRQLLGSRQVEAVGVQTAADCLEKLKADTFDCMVLDLSLPDASGFSLLETLSAEQTYSFPPVIVYTGRDLSADEEQRLRRYSKSIIIKGAKSPERLLDEVTLFLHQVVSDLPEEKQKMLEAARHREAALEGRRILIAEDDVRNIFALTSLLEPKGARIQIARNGREAVEALRASKDDPNKRIDLVLMDIMMPEMNGFAAMREIRKEPDWKRLPIIALTAKAMKSDMTDCIEAGANDYLSKPLDVEKLLSLIRVWMPR